MPEKNHRSPKGLHTRRCDTDVAGDPDGSKAGKKSTNQQQPMKTNRIAAVVTASCIAFAGTVWASPPGKHAVEKAPNHPAARAGSVTPAGHTVLKHTGPAGKGLNH